MKKAAVIYADGCEEGEVLTIVDILRRAEIQTDTLGMENRKIKGAHGIALQSDKTLSESDDNYHIIILPGGYGARDQMLQSKQLIQKIQTMANENKLIAAICAAPAVLDKAGLLQNRRFTCYPSIMETIKSGSYLKQSVVIDGNIITGEGPALVWTFTYQLVELLGGDAEAIKKRMAYDRAFQEAK